MHYLTSKKIFWLVALLLITNIALMHFHTIHEPFDNDIAGYAYSAQQVINGKNLYADIWEQKPPAIIYTFALFQSLFGYNDTSIYILNVFFSSLVLIFIGLSARELMGDVPALLTMLLYVLVLKNPHIWGGQPNTELMINAFKLMGVYLFLRAFDELGNRRWIYPALAGLSIGAASAFKMVVVFSFLTMLVALFLYKDERHENRRISKALVFSAAAGSVWAFIFLFFFFNGIFSAFWHDVFVFNRAYSPDIWHGLKMFFSNTAITFPNNFNWEYMMVISAMAFLGTLIEKENLKKKLLIVSLFIAACLEVAAPGVFLIHYYQLLIPFIILMSVWTVMEYVHRTSLKQAVIVSSVLAVIVVLPLVIRNARYFELSPDYISMIKANSYVFVATRDTGNYMKTGFRPGLTLFNWGTDVGLYYYSKMNTDIPYYHAYPLGIGKYEDVKRRLQETYDTFVAHPPDIFVKSVVPPYHTQFDDKLYNELCGTGKLSDKSLHLI